MGWYWGLDGGRVKILVMSVILNAAKRWKINAAKRWQIIIKPSNSINTLCTINSIANKKNNINKRV